MAQHFWAHPSSTETKVTSPFSLMIILGQPTPSHLESRMETGRHRTPWRHWDVFTSSLLLQLRGRMFVKLITELLAYDGIKIERRKSYWVEVSSLSLSHMHTCACTCTHTHTNLQNPDIPLFIIFLAQPDRENNPTLWVTFWLALSGKSTTSIGSHWGRISHSSFPNCVGLTAATLQPQCKMK